MAVVDEGPVSDRVHTVVSGALLEEIRANVLNLRDQVEALCGQAGIAAAPAATAGLAPPRDVPVLEKVSSPGDASTPSLYARCLGGFALYLNDRELSLGKSRAAQEIGRYLVAHAGKTVPGDDLIELVWPDADPDVAAHRLHVAVSALRHALERSGLKAAFIRHDEGGYTARKDLLVTDCDLFDRWYDAARRCMRDGDLTGAAVSFRKAIALYGGDYFADLPYAEWTHQARARYLERRMGALTFLCDQAEREGDYLEVVEHARAMLGADSLREVGHRHLMRAHYRLGQRGVAIRQYNLCCELLQRELGVGPSRLTRALYEAIRDDRELPEDHERQAP